MLKQLPRLAGAVLLLASLLACIGPGVSRTTPEAERAHVFEMELGELASQPPPPLKRPAVEPLAAEVIEQLAPAVVEPERKAFARRQDSQPPKPPKVLEQPFHPRTGEAPTSVEGPLEVLRVMPKGAVGRVPHLSVTFNQPMLALGAERASPVKLSPEPPGQWRWVGDRTLLFEPDGGFPLATDYSVVVPADTASAAGRRLAQAQEWTFSTPPPSLKESYPEGDRVGLRPVIFLRFDQKMRPADVLAHLKVTVGSAQYPLALANAVERAEDGQVLELVDEAEPDTWVAVRPTQELPRDRKVTVTLAAGCPSAEGPVPTPKPQAFDFHTYSPLKLAEKSHQPIRPRQGLWLRFNNPIDSHSFVKAMVRVEPSIPDLEVELRGDLILLEGTTSPKTTYTVSCHPKLTDVYGQQLGARAPFVFKVGKASPSLSSPASRYYRVDPKRPVFPVEAVSLGKVRLQVRRVEPSDLGAFRRYCQDYDRKSALPGQPLVDKQIELTDGSHQLDLPAGIGQMVVVVGPSGARWSEQIISWVQATDLNLDAMADEHQTVVFCTDVASGRPQAGVEVSLRPAGDKAVTDDHGLARLPARSGQIVAASRGGDRCFLYDLGSVTPTKPNLLWYVFDDRGLYRPGETFHLKGWVRQESSLKAWSGKLDYVAYDNDDHKLAEGKTTVRASGGFEISFALPDTPALGSGRVELHCPDDFAEATYEHRFRVEEFRRPEFEVEASSGEGPFFVGERGTAEVSARYYTGSPLTNAQVKWQVVADPETFEPPGHPEFHFGYAPEYQDYFAPSTNGLAFGFKWFEGRTDAQGNHILTIDFKSVWPPRPTRLDASATVQDVNRQKWSVGTSLLVHPSELYVGLRQIGATPRFEVLVTDLEGKPVSDAAVEVWLGNEHQQVVSALGPVTVEFASSRASRVGARVYDSKRRVNITELPVWLAGLSNSDEERISMRSDKPEYVPGETAQILVRAPFEAASGIFWCGLDRVEPVAFQGNLATLRVPVPEGVPNLRVEVLAVGADGQALRESLSLDVSLEPHRLGVEVTPASSQLEPGASTSVEVAVTGAEAAGCEVALWVVDESVLATGDYRQQDPLSTFFPTRYRREADDHSRSVTPPPDPWYNDSWGFDLEPRLHMLGAMGLRLLVSEDIDAGAEFSATRPASSHKVRSNFDPLAYFAGDLVTDAKGRATATIKLPDNLTRYRILAVAAGQRQFGTGQSNLTARLALMVRPSAPRFLNLGDSCQLPVVLHNQTERELETEVALRAANAHLGQAGFRVKVPANDRVEVLFEIKPDLPGQARFAVAARSGAKGDAARFELPVWTPAATQDLAVYGSLDDQLVGLPIGPPQDAYPGFGGLQVTTSSTAVASLDDALRYLEEYPFECSEQVASRLLGRVTMGARPEKIQADLDRLLQAQHYEGGWGFWAGQTDSDPFVSVHAFHALVRAKAAGWAIPERNWQQGLGHLADLGKACPPGYSQPAWFCLRAYGLYVRQLAGRSVSAASLVKEAGGLEQLPTEALGWLLPVLVGEQRQAARQVLLNRMDETASGVSFEPTLGSPERTQAVVLEGMLGDQPESELIPKLVRGLEDQRRDGRWRTTQENAWAVLALSRYFHTYEKQSPDFVSKVWLGNSYLGQHAFRGRSKVLQQQTSVPLAELRPGNLVLAKQGQGRLYYRVGLRYAPTDFNPPAQDRGFAVQRSYEAVDDNRDVARRADGSWRIRAGARVRVKLTMAVDGRRSQVALVDHLPAGLEAVNPSLAVSATAIPSESGPGWWWSGSWYEHQNLRDERVEAFSSTVWPGVYEYRYDALASTPGQFVAPAAQAEEMYHPETFGRSASDQVTVDL